MSFITEFKKEWLEQRRTKKFLVALIVLVLFGMTSPLLAKLTPQILMMLPGGESLKALIPTPTIADAVGQYLKNISQFGILLALLFSMGAIASEKEKGTAALILSKPMPRFIFLMAKFCDLTFTFTCSLAISGLLGYYYTVVLFGSVPLLPWLAMNGLLLLYLLIYTAITLFFSTLTRTQYIAAGGAFGVLILLSIAGSIPGLTKYIPTGLLENASNVMSGAGVAGWQCLWIGIGLIVVFLMSAWLIFRRQEL